MDDAIGLPGDRPHERWMRLALDEARAAAEEDEVPVGAVVAAARNERELRQDPTAHAEVLAIRDSSIALGGWRLVGCTVYVTLEPCPMCAGALLQARPERVVYGAPEPVSGAAGSVVDIFRDPRLPTRIPVEGGVMAVEAADLLRAFFAERRGH